MTVDLHPKTETVAAATIKPGYVILESHEHPATVTRVVVSNKGMSIYCRYVWSARTEKEWLLGSFKPRAPIEKAMR